MPTIPRPSPTRSTTAAWATPSAPMTAGISGAGEGSQTTGREGYERVKKQTGLDVVDNPDILIDPEHFCSARCRISSIAAACLMPKFDDVLNVTKRLNGGTIGLQDRIEWLDRWKKALGTAIDFSVPPGLGAARRLSQSPLFRPKSNCRRRVSRHHRRSPRRSGAGSRTSLSQRKFENVGAQ
jgi:hypothetical protein